MPPSALLSHLLLALPLALVSAAVVRWMMARPILDHPDHRKAHDRPTPKGGGLGPVVAFMLGMLALFLLAPLSPLAEPRFIGVVLAALAIAAVALADDVWDFRFLVKLGAQAVAALVALGSASCWSSCRCRPGRGAARRPRVGLTMFWIVGCTNAVNFMDGMDGPRGRRRRHRLRGAGRRGGERGGVVRLRRALFLGADSPASCPSTCIPARIFMGDVGSQFAGFLLAVLAWQAANFERSQVSFLVVPLLLFGLLWDAAFTLARRAWAGEAWRRRTARTSTRWRSAPASPCRSWRGCTGASRCWEPRCAPCVLRLPPAEKPLVVVPALFVQVVWTCYVAAAGPARRAALARLTGFSLPCPPRSPRG
jgi:UDP-GlcNAc:undecaprenyl-phosphate GlcNAc-1-phosphate transferase